MTTAAATRTIADLILHLWARFFPMPSFKPWLVCSAAAYGLTYGLAEEDQQFIADCLGLPVDQLPTDPVAVLRHLARGGALHRRRARHA